MVYKPQIKDRDYQSGLKKWPNYTNFVCQLDWPIRYSDIWSNVILDVYMRVFLDEDNIRISRPNNADCSL